MNILPLATLLTLLASPEIQAGPRALFNGKDLTGWTAVSENQSSDQAATWTVRDGVIHCTGKPAGYLRTERDDFHDYRLTVEWRWPDPTANGNSGVLVHGSKPAALGVWPRSIEVQLAHDNAGDFWVIPESVTLKIPDQAARQKGRRHLNLTDGAEKARGEWNTMEITCKNDTIRVKVNGTLMNEAAQCSETRGSIALQSEGTPIEFRKIEIENLD